MNSIETYSPPKVSSLESDEAATTSGQPTDAAALEALRALLGGHQQQQSLQDYSEPPAGGGSSGLLGMLDTLLADENLPPTLAALVAGLQGALSGGGDAASNPEALGQMQALLTGLQPAGSAAQQTPAAYQPLVRALEQEMAREGQPAAAEFPLEAGSLGQAILQSLDSQSSTAAGVNGAAPVVTQERIDQVSALMTQMADRVLVTDPLHGQAPEVRIRLAEDIMPGTEVRVWREDGGQLRVEFDTISPFWARALNEASPLLSQRLNERLQLDGTAQVTVQQHQDGQPEDGRSRNRYTPWDLAGQTAEEA